MTNIKTPDLIQLATIRQNWKQTDGVDALLDFEYMGAAQFEFGALPKTLDRLISIFTDLKVTMNKDIVRHDGKRLCVISTKEVYDEYIFYIRGLASPPKDDKRYSMSVPVKDPKEGCRTTRQLHEPSHFYRCYTEPKTKENRYRYYDVWWDVENDVIWTFGKENANNILKAIGNVRTKRSLTS